jgi:hypothetical protein
VSLEEGFVSRGGSGAVQEQSSVARLGAVWERAHVTNESPTCRRGPRDVLSEHGLRGMIIRELYCSRDKC